MKNHAFAEAAVPRLSVVIPAFNAEATLAETLDAVVDQRLDRWQCVVVDDGSSDATLPIAERYAAKDSRFRVISQQNRGSGGAYNTGVRASVADWVVICSADDILMPNHLETMAHSILTAPDSDIFTSNGWFLYPNGRRELVYSRGNLANRDSWTLAHLFDRCFFSVGACYRRAVFTQMGGYDEHIYGEDYDFWLRALASGARHRYIDEALSLHRVFEGQKTSDLARVYESDIRSIAGVVDRFQLTPGQSVAARRAMAHRRRLVEEIQHPRALGNRLRRAIRATRKRGRRA